MDEDFFLPVAANSELARIEVLVGPNYRSAEDVAFFLRKLEDVKGD